MFHDGLPESWNQRILTLSDFESFCEQERIGIVELPFQGEGLYLDYLNTPIILLNRGLPRFRKWFVAFHELAHFWLHKPGAQCSWAFESKLDFEANIVAACALIPRPLLLSKSHTELHRTYGYSRKLIRFRRDLHNTWNL